MPNVKFFHVFSSRCFIFNSKEHRNKFDVKADEGIFLGYSLTSKAYRVLNKRLMKIEETYYVTFDDNYVKKLKTTEGSVEEIFPKSGQVTVPISNLCEQCMLLFDEPEKAIHSESKAADKKVDNLKKIIDDVAKKMLDEQPTVTEQTYSSEPPKDSSYVQREGSSSPNKHDSPFQGESPSSSIPPESQGQGENSEPEAE